MKYEEEIRNFHEEKLTRILTFLVIFAGTVFKKNFFFPSFNQERQI